MQMPFHGGWPTGTIFWLKHRDTLTVELRRQRFLPLPAGRYAAIMLYLMRPFARLHQDQFAAAPGQILNSLTSSYTLTNPLNLDSRKQAIAPQA
jgi:hypothetical protein